MRAVSCFSEDVGRPKKSKDIDSELDDVLGLIEAAWRAKHANLTGLVYKKGEKGIIASSTWFGWRDGSRSPKYMEIHRVARAVGLDVRPLIKDGSSNLDGGLNLTSEMRRLMTIVGNLPPHLQHDIVRFAEDHKERWASANPTEADAAKHQ